MNWTQLLTKEIESTYGATEGLMRLVDPERLDWKPDTGSNWMTTGQLLWHLTDACGFCVREFVSGTWGDPPKPGGKAEEMSMPTAATMPSVASVDEALAKLAEDRRVALAEVQKAGEKALDSRTVVAPWDPTPIPLGRRLLSMVHHLRQHKGQLFYYLKLQGKPVHTGNLWGM
jgi:hypothetical protein